MRPKRILLSVILGVGFLVNDYLREVNPFLNVYAEELASDWFVNDHFRSEIANELNEYYGFSGLTADTIKKEDLANYFYSRKYRWNENRNDLLQGDTVHDLSGLEYAYGYNLMYEKIDYMFKLKVPESLTPDSRVTIQFTNGIDGNGENYDSLDWSTTRQSWNLEYIFDNPDLLNKPNIEINTVNYGSSELPPVLMHYEHIIDDTNFTDFEINLSEMYKNNFVALNPDNSTLEIILSENYLGDVVFTNAYGDSLKYRLDLVEDFYNTRIKFSKIEGEYKPGIYTTNNGQLPDTNYWDEIYNNTILLKHYSNDTDVSFKFQGRAAISLHFKGIVNINYIDENGLELLPSKIFRGQFNIAYDIFPQPINGYEFKEFIGDSQGYFDNQIKDVTLVYKKASGTSTTVEVPTTSEDEKLPKTSKIDDTFIHWLFGGLIIILAKKFVR